MEKMPGPWILKTFCKRVSPYTTQHSALCIPVHDLISGLIVSIGSYFCAAGLRDSFQANKVSLIFGSILVRTFMVSSLIYTANQNKNIQGISYKRIFASPQFVYNKIFLTKLSYKLVAQIFTLLLAPFASKLVNYSSHSAQWDKMLQYIQQNLDIVYLEIVTFLLLTNFLCIKLA